MGKLGLIQAGLGQRENVEKNVFVLCLRCMQKYATGDEKKQSAGESGAQQETKPGPEMTIWKSSP